MTSALPFCVGLLILLKILEKEPEGKYIQRQQEWRAEEQHKEEVMLDANLTPLFVEEPRHSASPEQYTWATDQVRHRTPAKKFERQWCGGGCWFFEQHDA